MACVRCGIPLPQYTVLCTGCGTNQYQVRVTARVLFWAVTAGFGLILALASLDPPGRAEPPDLPSIAPLPVGHP
ncbi:MAG TPA: hypothetical protein VHR41_14670 [Gemmatimonadales bacterium]|jgi:hypothetical protein|nr:hypothetical protein [Gemmatimonadales bacterium]